MVLGLCGLALNIPLNYASFMAISASGHGWRRLRLGHGDRDVGDGAGHGRLGALGTGLSVAANCSAASTGRNGR
jgi:hypothetical protein